MVHCTSKDYTYEKHCISIIYIWMLELSDSNCLPFVPKSCIGCLFILPRPWKWVPFNNCKNWVDPFGKVVEWKDGRRNGWVLESSDCSMKCNFTQYKCLLYHLTLTCSRIEYILLLIVHCNNNKKYGLKFIVFWVLIIVYFTIIEIANCTVFFQQFWWI